MNDTLTENVQVKCFMKAFIEAEEYTGSEEHTGILMGSLYYSNGMEDILYKPFDTIRVTVPFLHTKNKK